jgi:hypothetical protein
MAKVSGMPALLFLLTAACSSRTAQPPTEISTPSDFLLSCGSERPGSTPPAATSTNDGSGVARWFSIGGLSLGLHDLRTNTRSTDAWRCYGFDLDGQTTTAAVIAAGVDGSCKRVVGAPPSVLVDGAGGIDNSFGRWIAPVLGAFDRCLGRPSVADAGYAFLLRVDGDPTADATHVGGALFLGQLRAVVGATSRPFSDAPPATPVATFPDGYVEGGFWISGPPSDAIVDLPLPVGFDFAVFEERTASCPAPKELRLPVASLRMTVDAKVGDGQLGGALPVSSLRSSVSAWLASAGHCPGTVISNQMVEMISEGADVALGAPSLRDPERTCDAVSLGVGFALTPLEAPPPLIAASPPVAACAP